MFSVWSFISSNFSPDENFKILLSPLSPPTFDFEKFQFPQILLSSKIQSPLHKVGGGAAVLRSAVSFT